MIFILVSIKLNEALYWETGEGGGKFTNSKGSGFWVQGREERSGLEGYLIDLYMLEVSGILKRRPVKDHIQSIFIVYFPESHPRFSS